jgi:hypothetical protein
MILKTGKRAKTGIYAIIYRNYNDPVLPTTSDSELQGLLGDDLSFIYTGGHVHSQHHIRRFIPILASQGERSHTFQRKDRNFRPAIKPDIGWRHPCTPVRILVHLSHLV